MTTIAENLQGIRDRINAAALRAGRDPAAVRLVAVSKRVPLERLQEAVAAGQLVFGENYLQEADLKIKALGGGVEWHFIGHLQSNKAKLASTLFDAVETVDRLKLATALDRHLAGEGKRMPVLLQVNIGREVQKSGVLPEDAEALLRQVNDLPNLAVRGLMAMPPYFENCEDVRPFFRQLRQMADAFVDQGLLGQHGPLEVSMGMSGDYEVAVEEGATLVRVGTALFGERL
ncbi:MAG: YggS family pyridoxal phosphate-dependent enzyme [Desulfobulbaceae bacterium]|nr:YggS family pyridoxal phosphate-dependent enzyme [Desulfobulbaceae bacterium]